MYDTYDNSLVAYSRSGMCGRNNTLTDGSTVLIVRHGTLILNYTWTPGNSENHTHDLHSTFTLKFNSFYKYTDKDDCSGKGFHQCSNSRCVHSDAYCQAFMNGCGYTMADQCERDAEAGAIAVTDIFTTIASKIKQYVWVIVIGIAICIVLTCLRSPRSLLRRSHIGHRLFDRLCCNHKRSATQDLVAALPMNERRDIVQETDLHLVDVETSSSISSDHYITQRVESSTSTIGLRNEIDLPDNSLHPPSPTSYDDVVLPSNEHYMSNQDIYKVS